MDADILLLQEVNPKWHSVMDKPMVSELGYTVVPTSTEITPVLDGRANYTPIWYRADKLDLVDYGYKQYETVKLEPDAHLSSSKSYTWALFKDKATGKQIITISTHFTWAPEDFNPSPDQCRVMDAKEVVELVGQLETEYAGVPIILMGDLNCTTSGNPYDVLYDKFRAVDSVCEEKNQISKGTTHSVGSTSVVGSVIDHTLYTGDALNFKMYQHVYNEWSFNSTDHIPLLLDVQFK
jgi:endonuclease/exonuclease/phosphatase family metal-dependent hydrolase